jgi:hypothetical protein
MPIELKADDLIFQPGFEQALPEELRDYAKDAKDLVTLVKRGADTQREFHTRVKLPTDETAKRAFLKEHFSDVLDADSKNSKEDQEKAKTEEATRTVEQGKAKVKELWGADEAAFNNKLELARRAFHRGDLPPAFKQMIADAAGVKPEELTDDQFREIVTCDPFVAETLRYIGDLTKDGRTITGDGHHKGKEEKTPIQPQCPELYKNRPDTDPEKMWFVNRGYDYGSEAWQGRPPI